MTAHFFRRRTVLWPTLLGWAGLSIIFGIPFISWSFQAEPFLAKTQRQPADILVVEGWIGIEGIKAAKTEFEQGGYRYLIASGGMSDNRWNKRQWNLAVEAEEMLLSLGLSKEQVIAAASEDVHNHRTFASAIAVSRALQQRGIQSKAVNVFTLSVHARRSRLVYAKVLPSEMAVGVISWAPPGYYSEPWWHSSERTLDLLKESVGYPFEALLNSGRLSNSAIQPGP